MIDVLVSDLGQVVLPFSFEPCKRFLRERCRCTAEEDPWARLSALHEAMGFGEGRCTSRQFHEAVSASTGLDVPFEEFCAALSDVFWEEPATIDLLRRVRVRHRFLLSNTNAIHWEWILSRHAGALSCFDRLLASQEIGLSKPDPRVYHHVQGLTGLPPSAHLLVDDLPANVEGARACGWDGIVHTDAAHLEAELRARGLL